MSFAADNEFAEMLVPMVASINAAEAKNAAARLSHSLMSCKGSQSILPYKLMPAEVTANPVNPQRVNATGIMRIWTYWLRYT